MTIKTLSFIYSLLIKEADKAEVKKRWLWDAYVAADEKYQSGETTKADRDAKHAEYEAARAEHSKARQALQEFEEKEW